jgi:hypothetical protein
VNVLKHSPTQLGSGFMMNELASHNVCIYGFIKFETLVSHGYLILQKTELIRISIVFRFHKRGFSSFPTFTVIFVNTKKNFFSDSPRSSSSRMRIDFHIWFIFGITNYVIKIKFDGTGRKMKIISWLRWKL